MSIGRELLLQNIAICISTQLKMLRLEIRTFSCQKERKKIRHKGRTFSR